MRGEREMEEYRKHKMQGGDVDMNSTVYVWLNEWIHIVRRRYE